MTRRQFLLCWAGVVLLAFALREWYVLAAVVNIPIRGDITDYMRYAYNLVHSGVFSHAQPGTAIAPDAFRGPGYPTLLAAVMLIFPDFTAWLTASIQVQVVVGTATVAGVIALARQSMDRGPALIAGLLIAAWPHHIVGTGALLSEVLFGFLLIAALLLRSRPAWGGGVFGLAYLVNPIIALFPPILAHRKRSWVLLVVFVIPAALWGARGLTVPDAPGRAGMNFVQGSWPEYHEAYRWSNLLTVSRAHTQAIDEQAKLISEHPATAARQVAERMAADPLRYVKWYALEKPYLLWSWDIQLGDGGIYFLRTSNSLFEMQLSWLKAVAWLLNPGLFALALLGALWRRDSVGLLFLYLTAIHVIFQAEPRYAVAYRPVEMIAAVNGLLVLLQDRRKLAPFAKARRQIRQPGRD